MITKQKYVPIAIRVGISFLFLLSAVAKLYPSPYFAISTFEVKQLYPLGFSGDVAPFFSRILIGIEFALGLLILQKHYLRKLVIPATLLMLAVFTTHLTIVTFQDGGNSGNCGCFGSLLPMTPIEAILKNVVAMVLLVILLKVMPKKDESKSNFWILISTTLAFILLLFMLAPMQAESNLVDVTGAEPDDSAAIEVVDTVKSDLVVEPKKIDTIKKIVEEIKDEPVQHKSGYSSYFASIDKGRKTLCFFVPGCDHCREVAKELTEMKSKGKNFPDIRIIFMNEEADLIPDFFKFAGAKYPYKIIEVIPFWNVLGSGKDTPGVKYLWNGNEFKYYYGITDNKFNATEFSTLIQKPYSALKSK
ncbi:MAG: protein tlpB [Flavobacterium sp.]|nr:protein tlpB [Flavobacterium sp.]